MFPLLTYQPCAAGRVSIFDSPPLLLCNSWVALASGPLIFYDPNMPEHSRSLQAWLNNRLLSLRIYCARNNSGRHYKCLHRCNSNRARDSLAIAFSLRLNSLLLIAICQFLLECLLFLGVHAS